MKKLILILILVLCATVNAQNVPPYGFGDITSVWTDSTGDVSALTAASGDTLDATLATTTIPWRVNATSAPTVEGQAIWNSTTDVLAIGDGAATVYLALGASDGDALAGDSATNFFDAGEIADARIPNNITIDLATTVTTNANLTGEVTSVGNAATIADSVTVTGWVLGTSSATQITSPTLITDLIDTTGVADMDYGSIDVTDHTFTTDGGTVILDGSVTGGVFQSQSQVADFTIIDTTQLGLLKFYGDDDTASADHIAGQIEVISTSTWTDGAEDAKMVLNAANNGILNANQLVLNTDGSISTSTGIEITPNGDGDQDIISITPGTALDGIGNTWRGVHVDGTALTPGNIENTIVGVDVDLSGLSTTAQDPKLVGLQIAMPTTAKEPGRTVGFDLEQGKINHSYTPSSTATTQFTVYDQMRP